MSDLSAQSQPTAGPRRLLVTGASGLIGSALVPALERRGHTVLRLTRGDATRPGEFRWDPARGTLDPRALEGVEGVVHLAGADIATRWTAAAKARILSSRVLGTRLLATALAALERPPTVLVSVSAMGWYGDRGEEVLTEHSSSGEGFVAQVCRAWEAAAAPAATRGIRVVHPRLGLVLTPDGGALRPLLIPFRLGLGGALGRGRAWWSWITLPDVLAVLVRAIEDEALSGPVNTVAPHPVRNSEFAATLGRVLRRPAVLPVPPFLLRLALGRMADEMLLASIHVAPARLLALGHHFESPELEGALRRVLGPPGGAAR
jgi:uncharacterized protein